MINFKKIFGRNIRSRVMRALSFVPDKLYLRLFYLTTTGRILHLKNPTLFNEKVQWLKLHDRHPEYRDLVDKLAVKQHIDEVMGPGHVFPLLGAWDSFDEIDFSALPDSFVLKCNHDSGSTKVIRDKNALTEEDMKELRRMYNWRTKRDYYYAGREYAYKGIKPRIMAEAMIENPKDPGRSIEDYKFFCFNGEPKMVLIATDRSVDVRFDFFDMDFNHLDLRRGHPNSERPVEKPAHFEEMKEWATKLSKGMKLVRIDLYDIGDTIYFGEYTFCPGGGFALFDPMEWERRLGDWIDLS